MNELYRGKYYGVFSDANGYYVGRMADDGISHYAAEGMGWDNTTKDRCNAEAERKDELESMGWDPYDEDNMYMGGGPL